MTGQKQRRGPKSKKKTRRTDDDATVASSSRSRSSSSTRRVARAPPPIPNQQHQRVRASLHAEETTNTTFVGAGGSGTVIANVSPPQNNNVASLPTDNISILEPPAILRMEGDIGAAPIPQHLTYANTSNNASSSDDDASGDDEDNITVPDESVAAVGDDDSTSEGDGKKKKGRTIRSDAENEFRELASLYICPWVKFLDAKELNNTNDCVAFQCYKQNWNQSDDQWEKKMLYSWTRFCHLLPHLVREKRNIATSQCKKEFIGTYLFSVLSSSILFSP